MGLYGLTIGRSRSFLPMKFGLHRDDFFGNPYCQKRNTSYSRLVSPADDQLLEALRHHSDASHTALAALVQRPVPTVRKQLARLTERGFIRKGYIVLRDAATLPLRAMISIDFDLSRLKSESFSNQKEFVSYVRKRLLQEDRYRRFATVVSIESTEIILGGNEDVFLLARFKDQQTLVDFVTEVIRYLPGVAATNTATLMEPE